MSHKDDLTRLHHMLDHALEAIGFAEGRSLADLSDDRMLQLCLCRLVEIVGEAASHVSDSGRQELKDLPWLDIVGLRHRIIHGYDQVNLETLWNTVKEDLPPLAVSLKAAIARLEEARHS